MTLKLVTGCLTLRYVLQEHLDAEPPPGKLRKLTGTSVHFQFIYDTDGSKTKRDLVEAIEAVEQQLFPSIAAGIREVDISPEDVAVFEEKYARLPTWKDLIEGKVKLYVLEEEDGKLTYIPEPREVPHEK